MKFETANNLKSNDNPRKNTDFVALRSKNLCTSILLFPVSYNRHSKLQNPNVSIISSGRQRPNRLSSNKYLSKIRKVKFFTCSSPEVYFGVSIVNPHPPRCCTRVRTQRLTHRKIDIATTEPRVQLWSTRSRPCVLGGSAVVLLLLLLGVLNPVELGWRSGCSLVPLELREPGGKSSVYLKNLLRGESIYFTQRISDL